MIYWTKEGEQRIAEWQRDHVVRYRKEFRRNVFALMLALGYVGVWLTPRVELATGLWFVYGLACGYVYAWLRPRAARGRAES